MRLLILNVFLFLFYTNTRCQDTIINHTNKWIASANFGSSIYYGDLKKSSNPFWTNKYDRQWAYGIKLGRELNSTISVYGQLNKGNVGSSFGAQKFAYFKANYLQYFIGGDVNLLNLLLNIIVILLLYQNCLWMLWARLILIMINSKLYKKKSHSMKIARIIDNNIKDK